MDRLTSIGSSSPEITTGYQVPYGNHEPPKENQFNYWSYFVDPDPKISIWARIVMGAALPILGPLSIFGCSKAPSVSQKERPSLNTNKQGGGHGRLVVFFETEEVPANVNEVLKKYTYVVRVVKAPQEEPGGLGEMLQEELKVKAKNLDRNRRYYIDLRDQRSAEILMSELKRTPGVAFIYPWVREYYIPLEKPSHTAARSRDWDL